MRSKPCANQSGGLKPAGAIDDDAVRAGTRGTVAAVKAHVKIVAAEAGDAQALTALAWLAKSHWGYPAEWMAAWRPALTVTAEYVRANPTFVAIEDERIVGFGAVQLGSVEARLDHLWVHPSRIGEGIGRALFEHAAAVARGSGAARLIIESDPHAEAFYRRMGARLCGTERAEVCGAERVLPLLEKLL